MSTRAPPPAPAGEAARAREASAEPSQAQTRPRQSAAPPPRHAADHCASTGHPARGGTARPAGLPRRRPASARRGPPTGPARAWWARASTVSAPRGAAGLARGCGGRVPPPHAGVGPATVPVRRPRVHRRARLGRVAPPPVGRAARLASPRGPSGVRRRAGLAAAVSRHAVRAAARACLAPARFCRRSSRLARRPRRARPRRSVAWPARGVRVRFARLCRAVRRPARAGTEPAMRCHHKSADGNARATGRHGECAGKSESGSDAASDTERDNTASAAGNRQRRHQRQRRNSESDETSGDEKSNSNEKTKSTAAAEATPASTAAATINQIRDFHPFVRA